MQLEGEFSISTRKNFVSCFKENGARNSLFMIKVQKLAQSNSKKERGEFAFCLCFFGLKAVLEAIRQGFF